MGILGITNRSENWKTVENFYGLEDDAKIRLAQRLGEPRETRAGDMQIELFWYGIRDYMDQVDGENRPSPEAIGTSYNKPNLFRDLRSNVQTFRAKTFPYGFNSLKPHNYLATEGTLDALFSNVSNTEVDIVLETPTHLFIGEAKHEEDGFDTDGTYVLVHQLIRQYVTAAILVDLTSSEKQVAPFVVGDSDKLASLKNTAQVKFMISQGWLREENALSWDYIERLTKA